MEARGVEKERKKLQDKNEKLEAKMDDMINEKVASKEAELHATYDERLRNYDDREKDLQKQVALVKGQLRDLRQSNESTQAKLLDHSSRQGNPPTASTFRVAANTLSCRPRSRVPLARNGPAYCRSRARQRSRS